jgi:hypothetical protein
MGIQYKDSFMHNNKQNIKHQPPRGNNASIINEPSISRNNSKELLKKDS